MKSSKLALVMFMVRVIIVKNFFLQALICLTSGDSTCGQRAVYEVGLTGIPVYNVNNNCSTGSTALFLAKQLVSGGVADCVLALGFEKMERGSLGMSSLHSLC